METRNQAEYWGVDYPRLSFYDKIEELYKSAVFLFCLEVWLFPFEYNFNYIFF